MMEYHIAIVIICLIFSALFSGFEIAFATADKMQIENLRKRGQISGIILAHFFNKPSSFIGTMVVGNHIAIVVYGIFMAILLGPLISGIMPNLTDAGLIIIQVLLAASIALLTAEFLPRSLFLFNPEWLLTFFAPFIWIIYQILKPVAYLFIGPAKFIVKKVMKQEYSADKPAFGATILPDYIKNNLMQAAHAEEMDVDPRIFTNALEFKTVKVRECMVPRTDLEAVDIEDGIEELREAFIRSGHSKILVYRDSIDDIIGYCHSLEIFKKPKEINSIINPIIIVPETMLANELLIQFITEHKSIALVVDEFGGTSGVVTIEDIIEKIFGDIQDEHDIEEWVEQKVDEDTYLLSARHEIDYLNDQYHWGIPQGDYDTLGGFILSITENIPSPHEVIEYPPFKFTIMSMQDNRIDIVKLTLNEIKETKE